MKLFLIQYYDFFYLIHVVEHLPLSIPNLFLESKNLLQKRRSAEMSEV